MSLHLKEKKEDKENKKDKKKMKVLTMDGRVLDLDENYKADFLRRLKKGGERADNE